MVAGRSAGATARLLERAVVRSAGGAGVTGGPAATAGAELSWRDVGVSVE